MLKLILNLLLRRHTIEQAMSAFHKAQAKLDAVEKQEEAEIMRREEKIERQRQLLTASVSRLSAAAKQRTRLRRLLGDDEDDKTISGNVGGTIAGAPISVEV